MRTHNFTGPVRRSSIDFSTTNRKKETNVRMKLNTRRPCLCGKLTNIAFHRWLSDETKSNNNNNSINITINGKWRVFRVFFLLFVRDDKSHAAIPTVERENKTERKCPKRMRMVNLFYVRSNHIWCAFVLPHNFIFESKFERNSFITASADLCNVPKHHTAIRNTFYLKR